MRPHDRLPGRRAGGGLGPSAGDSTDGRIPTLDLVILEDDRRYFPPYEAVPLVRIETLTRHPELADALNALAGKVDARTMQRLNHEVDGKHRDPGLVAREFLKSLDMSPANGPRTPTPPAARRPGRRS